MCRKCRSNFLPQAIDASARIVPLRQEPLKARLGERFRELNVRTITHYPYRQEAPDATRQ
jgi:hypothetical protein